MSSIYDAIRDHLELESPKPPTSFAQFYSTLLTKAPSPESVVTIIFEEAEGMIDLDEEAFACFCRLHLTIPYIKLVIVSKLPWEWLAPYSMGMTPISIRLPGTSIDIASTDDQVTILVEKMCRPMLGSVGDLRAMTGRVKRRTCSMKEIISTCGDVMNLADYCGNVIELPPNQAYLLIAAYIASFNPLSHDVKTFGSEGIRRKRRRRVFKESKLKSASDLNTKDALPKPFDVQRLLAIYYFIVADPVPSYTHLTAMLDDLMGRKYLIRANKNSKNKLKINVTREQVELLSKHVNCKLEMYLKSQQQ